MSSSLKVFADTSFFKAYLDKNDEFHQKALKIFNKLRENSALLVTSNYILDESFTLLRVKCSLEIAIEFKTVLEKFETGLKIVRVTAIDEAAAWDWFVKDWSYRLHIICSNEKAGDGKCCSF